MSYLKKTVLDYLYVTHDLSPTESGFEAVSVLPRVPQAVTRSGLPAWLDYDGVTRTPEGLEMT